jgi:hypothetical protein
MYVTSLSGVLTRDQPFDHWQKRCRDDPNRRPRRKAGQKATQVGC